MMLPAHPILLSPMAMYSGTIMAMTEALVCVKKTILQLWLGIILFPYGWFLVVHSQYHGAPEVVIPLRITSTGIGMKTQVKMSYRMHFGGQNKVIHMKVNKQFLSRHFQVFTYSDQGALLEDQPFVKNDCYYHGYVEGDPESLVALSTCLGGLQGILQTNDIVYEIEPKGLSTTFEHFIYKVDSEETPMRCGVTDEKIARQLKFQEGANYTLMQSGYEDWWTHNRILELAVVVDHNRYLHHRSNTTAVQYEVLLLANIVDNFLSPLDVDMVVKGIEVWTKKNPIEIDNIVDLLEEFCIWKQSSFNSRIPHDIAHLFVKRRYGITLGIAFKGTVCNFTYNCGVESLVYNLYIVAYTMIHEIGHNFGMEHDGPTCTCGHTTCVMFKGISGATKFSNCSYATFINITGSQNCMYISSDTGNIFTFAQCGNSVVEEGEECDCGAFHLCRSDPCCESNCILKPGAACASGLCCKNCQFLPRGELCRQQENECDLPEWCNGTSYHCPDDVYMQNGVSCKGGGYCYEKRCNNREEQCRNIFGKEAKNANQSCYAEMNTRGDRFGNCGLMNARYVKCNISDTLCGRIQCENVTELPLLRDHSTVHWTHFNGVTCWGTDYHFGMTIPDIGDVKDGTECGAEHVCIQRKCVHRSLLVNDCAPKTCNLKGVCNNRQHCHCNYAWDPPFCLERGHGGSIDSGPPPRRTVNQKTNYLGLLWLIRFVLLLCLLILSVLTH